MKYLALLAALAVAACGGDKPAAKPDAPVIAAAPPAAAPAATGAEVFARTCRMCHQANGLGQAGTFPPLDASPFVLGDKSRLIRIVLHGVSGPINVGGAHFDNTMPPWKDMMSDAELAAVLTFVRSSWSNRADAVTALEVSAQRAATAGRTTPYTAAELR